MRNNMCCLAYIKEKRENEKFIRLFTYYFFHSLLNLLNKLFILGTVKYDPLRASSYLATPKELKHRGALINVINRNEKCFLWSVLASVHEARDNPHRVTNYRRFENTINMNGTSYPVKLRDIDRFENLNENISVNFFYLYLFIIFISSWYKIVKSTNKNQPSTRYNYSFHATVRTKENVRLDIVSSTVKTTACIYWIPIHTIQLKFYYK